MSKLKFILQHVNDNFQRCLGEMQMFHDSAIILLLFFSKKKKKKKAYYSVYSDTDVSVINDLKNFLVGQFSSHPD